MGPRYPVYIISKGRWESRLTARALDRMAIWYRIVVEPQEADAYRAAMTDPDRVLVLPFSNLGRGSIPARNWVFEHARAGGAARHWILDDNIKAFFRFNRNLKVPARTGAIFAAMEDLSDRYENVALSGPHYFMFVRRKYKMPPIQINTRVYSCILVNNDIPFLWRGRYNEDTDLSLRVLKAGWCTLLFIAFLAEKMVTMSMRGGNTDSIYADKDGRLRMARSLELQHPDVVKVVRKWGRWQHHVDYRPFRGNRLRLRPGVDLASMPCDEYGMVLSILGNGDEVSGCP